MRRVQPEAKWFCKLDAIHGYFQVPLDEESQLLTALLLPNWKWIYVVAPMGMNISSDEYNIRSDRAVAEYLKSWLLKIVDNMAIQGATLQEVFVRLLLVLLKCREAGIKLSLAKLKVIRRIKFAGFIISSNGISPDPDKLAALRHFPTPKKVS